MALKTDYKAFIAPETGRRFHQTPNSDGTVTMTDVTVYTQEGDYYGPEALNTTNAKVNEIEAILGVGVGAHNGIYGGRFLGNAVTGEQYAAISAGTFEDLYIGDYWTIDSVNYRIAAFDYFYNTGDTALTTHHVTIVPDTSFYSVRMNSTDVTTGGYVGSLMYTSNLTLARNNIKSAFGNRVVAFRDYLISAVTNGLPSAGGWYTCEAELMNERMVYGSNLYSPVSNGVNVPYNYTVCNTQLPLFALRPDLIGIRQNYWLRDVLSATTFACVTTNGTGGGPYPGAATQYGVRPFFSIA